MTRRAHSICNELCNRAFSGLFGIFWFVCMFLLLLSPIFLKYAGPKSGQPYEILNIS